MSRRGFINSSKISTALKCTQINDIFDRNYRHFATRLATTAIVRSFLQKLCLVNLSVRVVRFEHDLSLLHFIQRRITTELHAPGT